MLIEAIVGRGPVIPVVAIDDPAAAVPLANALLAGGISVIEVTLRTPVALQCIERIRRECDAMVTGAGTVLDGAALRAVTDAGAQFAVSPGVTESLIDAYSHAATAGRPAWLPAAASVSESMRLRDAGFDFQKFFPANASGGAVFLRSVASVLPGVRYCPTGGIDADNAASYLELPNVAAVGGSWLAPPAAIARGDFDVIERLARAASKLA